MSDESEYLIPKVITSIEDAGINKNGNISIYAKYTKTYLKLLQIGLVILIPVLLIIIALAGERNYGLLSGLLIISAMVPFFLKFERRKAQAGELAVIAVMATLAALGRVMFAPIPDFKPTSAIVIITAAAFGPEAGFLTGTVAAAASNLFLGQGPWTPWQMFAWGLIGLGAGIFSKGRLKGILFLSVYGFLSGFFFGWIMNIWMIIAFTQPVTWQTIAAVYISSFWFDFTHGLSTLIFLLMLAKPWLRKINRIKIKYGLME